MKRLTFLFPSLLIAGVCSSYATSVTFSAAGARPVVDASSTQIANGDLVWVGNFANTSFTFNPALSIAANISAIQSAGGWHQFTLDTSTGTPDASVSNSVTIGGLGGGGKVIGTVTDNNFGSTKADFFNGKTIYLWVFNSTSVGTATQMGIFTGGSLASPAWTFPINTGGGGADAVSVGTDTTSAPNLTAVGGAGSVSATNLKLAAAVPEPSTLATLAGATGVLAMMRRRKSTR